MAIIGYIRVSSTKQTLQHQRFEIEQFAKKNHILIDKWVMETISSRKALSKRKLGQLLDSLNNGDILIAAEISRLGRSLLEVMRILESCLNKNCQVWTLKENYRLGNDIQSKVMAFAFGLSAEIERNLISQRTKEALARKKSEGVVLGRPKGSLVPNSNCEKKREWIREMISLGVPKTDIAKNLHVARGTLYRFLSNAATTSTSAGSQLTECSSDMFNHLAASCSSRVNSPPTTEQ